MIKKVYQIRVGQWTCTAFTVTYNGVAEISERGFRAR